MTWPAHRIGSSKARIRSMPGVGSAATSSPALMTRTGSAIPPVWQQSAVRLKDSGVRGGLEAAVALHPLPAQSRACQRGERGLDDNQVHQLPVDEWLQRKRPQRSRPLAVQPERVNAHAELNDQEGGPDQQYAHRVEEDQSVELEHVDHRRQ